MSMRKIGDVVATVGTYTKNGQEKKRYAKCGVMFEDDQGRLSMKVDTMPVTPDWSGWLSVFFDDNKPANTGQRTDAANDFFNSGKQEQPAAQSAPDDDAVPF